MTLLTPKENKPHLNKANCKIGLEGFGDDNEKNQHKFRDSCHSTGKYRSAVYAVGNTKCPVMLL